MSCSFFLRKKVFGHFAAKQLSSFEVVFLAFDILAQTHYFLVGIVSVAFEGLEVLSSDIYPTVCASLEDIP